jgi:predicted SAM-dependent methyltransferase
MTPSTMRNPGEQAPSVVEAALPALPDGPMLNIGSGPAAAPGWVNIDGSWQARLAGHRWLARALSKTLGVEVGHWPTAVQYRNVKQGLGCRDGSVAAVYASHLVEHLYREEALTLLREIRRVLKPGGICRIVVPDVAAIVGWYLAHQREPAAQKQQPSSELLMGMMLLRPSRPRGRGVLGFVRQWTDLHEHKWMYDEEGLLALFAEAGFTGAEPRAFLSSAIARDLLSQVEHADRVVNGAGVCVEGRR